MSEQAEKPKIGLALSGGSGKAIAHIGVLEVLREANIQVDYVTACSSGVIVAGSYACGTMDQLKSDWLKWNRKFLYNMMEFNTSGRAIFRLEKVGELLRKYMNRNLEDVSPRLGFTCVDILTGEPILLTMGDMIKAGQASSAVPGIIEPVRWGNKLLVDGGLYSITPTEQVRAMGADIVIGVSIASTPYGYARYVSGLREGYMYIRESLPARIYVAIHNFLDKLFTRSLNFFYNQSDILEQSDFQTPGILGILGRAIDVSTKQRLKMQGRVPDCDLLITPKVRHIGKLDMASAGSMLAEGRRAAAAALPEIKRIIEQWQPKK